jgi:glycosyltransferase involved in cell wall biosynthesis
MKSKVSVVVPIYNMECYIRRCIESILNQSYIDIELLLIDDGSVDESAKIIDE